MHVSKPKGKIVELEREKGVERRECEVEVSLVGESRSQGWGLGVRKVVQRKDRETRVWGVERVLG